MAVVEVVVVVLQRIDNVVVVTGKFEYRNHGEGTR